jgi:hypothetical protein
LKKQRTTKPGKFAEAVKLAGSKRKRCKTFDLSNRSIELEGKGTHRSLGSNQTLKDRLRRIQQKR